MKTYHFSDEDKLFQCNVGIDVIKSHGREQFPLEKILEEVFPGYAVRHLTTAKICAVGLKPYESPALILNDRRSDDEILCVTRDAKNGLSFYDFYSLKEYNR